MTRPDKQRPALCLIHGWAFDSRALAGLATEFTGLNTRLISLPGYGDRLDMKTPENIDAVADALLPEIPPHSIIAGWSLGGMVAINIAYKLQNSISAIILLASTPCFIKKNDWSHGVEHALVQNMAERIQENTEMVLREFAGLTARGDLFPRQTLRRLGMLLETSRTKPATLRAGLNLLMNTDLRREFSALGCGIMMIAGKNDELIGTGTGIASREINPAVQLMEIQDAGHAPFISGKSRVVAAVDKLLWSFAHE